MLLAIDIGNSNITLGFLKQINKATWRMATNLRTMPDEYGASLITLLQLQGFSRSDIKEVSMCSTVAQ